MDPRPAEGGARPAPGTAAPQPKQEARGAREDAAPPRRDGAAGRAADLALDLDVEAIEPSARLKEGFTGQER